MRIRCACLVFLLAVLGGGVQAAPSIEITHVPPFGSFNNLSGRIVDASPATTRVAVFIYVPGAGWWSKPFCNPQLTLIQPDTSWTADITTGGSDQFATKITTLLVSTNYNEPCVQGLSSLPANVTSQAIASNTVERYDPSLRWITFSGYEWWVKTGPGLIGPGPNYFSDSTNNVWVDGQGQLHLRISSVTNQWRCAEIVSSRTFGYGSYRFEVNSVVNNLDVNAVLGLFTWSDDPAYAHREIDIECSRWSNPGDASNSQFVIQPWDTPGHLVRYTVPAGQTNSTHFFTWETNRVTFRSQRGSFAPNPAPTNVISSWTYNLDVPQSGDENVRLNLWLFNGAFPAGGSPVEVIIKGFQFVPLGPAHPAVLTNVFRETTGQTRFTIEAEKDRRYEVQTSTNLQHWVGLATLLATSNRIDFTDANGGNCSFYRTLTLP